MLILLQTKCLNIFLTRDFLKEFLMAINITSSGKPEEKLEWAFQMYARAQMNVFYTAPSANNLISALFKILDFFI